MITVRGVKKSFGSHRVLAGVDFVVERGESVVIMGRSGCGKSILLKHLIGLIEPDEGEVLIDGRLISGLNERELLQVRRKFGMLFQSAALFDSMTVADNVAFPLRRGGQLTESEIARRVEEALDMVNLHGSQHKKPSELSGGMRKRVGLARAIVYQPDIVLYDEPTTGLDPIMSDSIDQLIMQLGERLKRTSVIVTHDMRSARRVGQRLLLLHEGRMYVSGSPGEIFASTDPIVHHFVRGISDSQNADF